MMKGWVIFLALSILVMLGCMVAADLDRNAKYEENRKEILAAKQRISVLEQDNKHLNEAKKMMAIRLIKLEKNKFIKELMKEE